VLDHATPPPAEFVLNLLSPLDLAGINFASHSTPLTNHANNLFTRFRDRHSIDDECSVVALDRFGNAFPKLGLDVLVAPGTLADKPFEWLC